MAGRLIGAKPLSEPMLADFGWIPTEQNSVKFQLIFRHIDSRKFVENVVCEMAHILSLPQWVNNEPALV